MLPLSYLLLVYYSISNTVLLLGYTWQICCLPQNQENLDSLQWEFSLCEGLGRSTDTRREANDGCHLRVTRHYQLWGKLRHASTDSNAVLIYHDGIFGKLNPN